MAARRKSLGRFSARGARPPDVASAIRATLEGDPLAAAELAGLALGMAQRAHQGWQRARAAPAPVPLEDWRPYVAAAMKGAPPAPAAAADDALEPDALCDPITGRVIETLKRK